MNNFFNVAVLQLLPHADIEKNLHKGLISCEKAKELGADLALFPELWQIGYDLKSMIPGNALADDDEFIQQFCDKAQELEMAIAITYLGKGVKKPTNNVAVIDANGKIILNYAKVNICSFNGGTEAALEAGNQFIVADLHYSNGVVRIGTMICFDREFPESARALAAQGTEIILVPNSCAMYDDPMLGDVRLAQLRGRAFENMVGIALVNYPGPKEDGYSCGIDVDGKFITCVGKEEVIQLVSFDLEKIRKWRQEEVWGIAV